MTEIAETHPAPARSFGTRLEIIPVVLFAAFAAAPLLATFSGAEGYVLSLLTRVMIFGIAAMALDLILGERALLHPPHCLPFHELSQQVDEREHKLGEPLLDVVRVGVDPVGDSPRDRLEPAHEMVEVAGI